MHNYLVPLWSAVATFMILSFTITIPYLAWKYHKQGALTIWEMFVEYAMVFYLLAAFFMTLLPLPTIEAVANMTGPTTQLVPFQFIADFLRETEFVLTDPSTYGVALTQNVVIQPVFNIILTVPFGVFLRYYYKKDLKFTLMASFLLALFFEITQLTGVYGIYPRAFRLFDVDDLFLNTLGGVVGYWISPLLVYFFPTKEQIEQKIIQNAQKVSIVRRLVAYSIDLAVVRLVVGLFFEQEIIIMFFFALITSITMITTKGQTLGYRIVNIQVVSQDGQELTKKQIYIRQFSFYFFVHFIFILFNLPLQIAGETITTLLLYLVLLGAHSLLLFIHFIVRTVRKEKVYFYELLSKTLVISSL